LKNGAKDKIISFDEEVTGTKLRNPKTVVNSSLSEDIGFRDDDDDDNDNIKIITFYDIQRNVSNFQAYGKLSGNKY
jgi:hypothetical protein